MGVGGKVQPMDGHSIVREVVVLECSEGAEHGLTRPLWQSGTSRQRPAWIRKFSETKSRLNIFDRASRNGRQPCRSFSVSRLLVRVGLSDKKHLCQTEQKTTTSQRGFAVIGNLNLARSVQCDEGLVAAGCNLFVSWVYQCKY